VGKLQQALALAAKGFRVFPIKPGAKHPPLLTGWPTKATSDPALVEMYWLPMPDANVGIHCENLCVIDCDVAKNGNDSLEALRTVYDLPVTLTSNTPTGGKHLFYRLPEGHAGVPNSVGALGAGLDVRSTGGYVVAPGSTVAAGEYAFEHPGVAIAEAPDWLVSRLGQPRVKSAPERVADAPAGVAERAADWLTGQEPAVEGAGGDARTFAVACGLRDLGLSAPQALAALLDHWNDRCSPPWAPEDLDVRVGNAYRYASGEAGAKAASPEDFPLVDPVPGTIVPKKGTPGLLSLSAFAALEQMAAGYVIKGILLRASYAETFGAPGEGKTFVALDQAYHVAADREWMNRKVHTGPVLYLAYEGRGGMVKRAKALRQKYGDKDVPLYIVGAAFNLREKAGRAELGIVIAQLPAKPVLIVIDTFARALMGGDENSAQDVGAFNAAIAALIESTGACVMIIHHSGKDKNKGARGSSALLGAIDTEIEVDDGMVMARKQRDIEIADPIGFKLNPLVVGVDEDCDEVTSCVVEPAQVGAQGGLERVSGNAKRGFDILCERWPNNAPVLSAEWRDACAEFLGGKNVAQRFYDTQKILLRKGYIVKDDKGMITRKMT
jgi:hypothetical protein